MNKRIVLIALGIVALIIAGAGWYLASPLFIDDTVNEELPSALASETESGEQVIEKQTVIQTDSSAVAPDSEQANAQSSQDNQVLTNSTANMVEAAMDEQSMDDAESAMAAEFIVVAEGQFAGTDNLHQGSGKAIVYQNDDQRVLRFEEFSVTNGPDLHVILSKHPAPRSRSDVGEDYIDLGSLKGNIGNQNYEIPAEIDLSEYKSVVIYCVPFHVVFATATLS